MSERPRDPIWDTMVEIFEVPPRTPSAKALWGKLVAELRAAEATPQELRWAAKGYKYKYPGCALTPTALVKHFELALAEGRPRRPKLEAVPDPEPEFDPRTAERARQLNDYLRGRRVE